MDHVIGVALTAAICFGVITGVCALVGLICGAVIALGPLVAS